MLIFLTFRASVLILSGRDRFASFYPPCKLLRKNLVVHFQAVMKIIEKYLR